MALDPISWSPGRGLGDGLVHYGGRFLKGGMPIEPHVVGLPAERCLDDFVPEVILPPSDAYFVERHPRRRNVRRCFRLSDIRRPALSS